MKEIFILPSFLFSSPTGSANINDRSLLGDRDSELCLVTTDNAENTHQSHVGRRGGRGGKIRTFFENEVVFGLSRFG